MLINPRSSEQILQEIQILKIEQIQQIPGSLNNRHNSLFVRSNIIDFEQSIHIKTVSFNKIHGGSAVLFTNEIMSSQTELKLNQFLNLTQTQ